MLFRLRVRYGRRLIPEDTDAEEFGSLEEARQAAVEQIQDLVEAASLSREPPECDGIEISDFQGSTVLQVRVSEANG